MKGSTKTTQNYDVKVLKAKEIKEGNVVFDMAVNGVIIYGCWYKEGTSKKNGEEYHLISFPSQKSQKDGKYYSHCWFKIEDDVKQEIIDQLQALV
jgi:hypothetical protein